MSAIIPIPRTPIDIRVATTDDLPFMDALQKKYNRALGYFPTKQFEGYIETGGVLIAEERHEGTEARRHEGEEECRHEGNLASVPSCLRASVPLGYIISRDRYLKRDELGVIYQLCVTPGVQRGLIGASLVKTVFERSAYGCRLYCCWCAQDLEANYFWESLGFVPLAFRAGSSGKKRVHIFWQRRICADDAGAGASYWYPFQTSSGAIRGDRLVFPIPPGVHWTDVKAVSLPAEGNPKLEARNPKQIQSTKSKSQKGKPGAGQVAIVVGGRIKYIDRPGYVAPRESAPAAPVAAAAKQPKRKRAVEKIDPKYLKGARELRDRYLERINSPGGARLLSASAKYEVARKALPAAMVKPVFGPAAHPPQLAA